MTENTARSGNPLGRRSFLFAMAGVAPAFLSACAGSGANAVPKAEQGAFPVTLAHAFGSTTLTTAPQRIATLGYASHDVCIELGVLPVGVPQYELRGFGTSLWFNKAVTEMNAVMPQQYRDIDQPPYGQLEQLKPDLILAVNSDITKEQYQRLNEIAPVVAYPKAPLNTDWRTTTTMVGSALGQPKRAAELVASVEQGIAKAKASYSGLEGSTFVYLAANQAPGADFEVYDADSNQARILRDFGVSPSPALSVVSGAGNRKTNKTDAGSWLWDSRRAADLQADIDVVAVSGDKDAMVESRVLDSLPGAKRNALVLLKTSDDALALVEASPLGVKWATLTVLPELARASYETKKGS